MGSRVLRGRAQSCHVFPAVKLRGLVVIRVWLLWGLPSKQIVWVLGLEESSMRVVESCMVSGVLSGRVQNCRKVTAVKLS